VLIIVAVNLDKSDLRNWNWSN